MGDPNAITPNLDRMASEGVTFTNAVSGCPWCTPFRGCLLTSRYPHHCVQKSPQRLDPSLPVVTDVFNEHGVLWKYVCLEGQPVMMYNLNEDPSALANLAYLDTFNDKRAELQQELAEWISRTGDDFVLAA